jgi:hypothetical protein
MKAERKFGNKKTGLKQPGYNLLAAKSFFFAECESDGMWLLLVQNQQDKPELTFVAYFVGGGKLVATAGTTGGQYTATVRSCHALAKAVAVPAFGIRWLVGTLRHV